MERYRERAAEIRFLTLPKVDEQLRTLAGHPKLQAMVATLIYAGLRREELTWLQLDDVDLTVAPYGVIRIRAKTVGDERWEPKTRVNRVVPVSSAAQSSRCVQAAQGQGQLVLPQPRRQALGSGQLFVRPADAEA